MLTPSALNELRNRLSGEHVLSVYITGAQRSPAERSSWRTALQHELDAIAAAAGDDPEFMRARALLQRELARIPGFLPGAGWIAFATAHRLWLCEHVPVSLPTVARWRRGITMWPYLRVLKQTRPVVLALVDSRRARLFRYVAGSAIEPIASRAETFIDDLTDRNMSKRATRHTGVRGETATDVADRILHSEMERMVKQVASEVLALAGRDGCVVIGGPTVAVNALHHLLAPRLGERLMVEPSAYVLLSASAAQRVIERCAAELSQRLQHGDIAALLDLRAATGRRATGWRDTAAAVAAGQVETLLLTRRFLTEHESTAEELIGATLQRGGRVEEVTNEAAVLLEATSEGVAARLRFTAPATAEAKPLQPA